MFIYSPKILVTERETKGISLLVSTGHPLFLHHFHVRTQTISRPSKSMHAHDTFMRDGHRISRRKHYTVGGLQNMLITVTVYILAVIIRYLAHDTSPYFVDDTDGHCI